jgi:hypothetical protein
MKCVIVLQKPDKAAEGKGRSLGCEVVVADSWDVRGDASLFIAPGTQAPWDLISAGFNFMVRWDAAAPLWRYGVTAADLGTPAEKQATVRVTRDLRIPVYAPELLFVKDSDDGRALVATWRRECEHGDERLAFVRALYIVKPRFCALPRTWLADVAQRATQDARIAAIRQRAGRSGQPLVNVQIGPNQFVRCYAGQEQEVLRRIQNMRHGRGSQRGKGKR